MNVAEHWLRGDAALWHYIDYIFGAIGALTTACGLLASQAVDAKR